MTATTETALIELAHAFQQAVHDERKTDALLLASRMAQLIRDDAEAPRLVERNTTRCPMCERAAHVWTCAALGDGHIEACIGHRNEIMADELRFQRRNHSAKLRPLGIPYTGSAIEGTNPNGWKR